MATKYFCDGCDRELQPGMLHRITVSIQETGTVKQGGGDYELCKYCADNMNSMASPKNWTRYGPTPKRLVDDPNSASGKRVA